MLHPQSRAALALWSQGPSVTDPGFGPADVEAMRQAARLAAADETREPVAHVEDVDADGVHCRLVRPCDPAPGDAGRALVFLHGGGFVFGDLDTHDGQARRLANRTGSTVLAVDYRRPPEHRFPAAPDDVDAALGWLRANAAALALDPARLVAVGDSAGGNLALVAALRNPGAFAATVLVYPFTDPAARWYDPARDGGGLSTAEAAWYWEQYAATPADLDHPDLAPMGAAGLGGLPPTLVQVAGEDILRDENLELARRLGSAGVTVTTSTYDGMVHGFWRHPALFDAAEVALAEIASFVRAHV